MKPTFWMAAALAAGACLVKRDPPAQAPTPPAQAPALAEADAPADAATGVCGKDGRGSCPAGEYCRSCSQAARMTYFCTMACQSDADCKDPARPSCEGAPTGFCAQKGTLQACQRKCAAPDTPILTPTGERPIASLHAGDLVYSLDGGRLAAVPILAAQRTPAPDHQVVRATLDNGAALLISPLHPTADGHTFDQLAPGDRLGDVAITSLQSVPYPFDATYDILPDSDSHAYFAAGALVGSTL